MKENPNKENLEKIYRTLNSDLYKVLDLYLNEHDNNGNWPLGDDSTSDFIAHICGESKDSYYKYLRNPKLMIRRAKKEGYLSESFNYI